MSDGELLPDKRFIFHRNGKNVLLNSNTKLLLVTIIQKLKISIMRV